MREGTFFDRHVVSPSRPACADARPHTYRKSRDRSLAYQLDMFTERR